MSKELMGFLTDYTPADDEARAGMEDVRRQYAVLASIIDRSIKDCAEKTAGLRFLLQAKDCHVRAVLSAGRKSDGG